MQELSHTRTCSHHWFFELVGFYTANEERLTHTERPHQHLQGAFELAAQSGRALPRLNALQTHKTSAHNQISDAVNVYPINMLWNYCQLTRTWF